MLVDPTQNQIGLVLLSQDFRVVSMNDCAKNILGASPFELGLSVFAYHKKKSQKTIEALLVHAKPVESKGPVTMVVDVLSKVLMINFSFLSSVTGDGIPQYSMSFIDITKQTGATFSENKKEIKLKKIPVYHEGSLLFVEAMSILYCQSEGNYCKIITDTTEYYIHQTLKYILQQFSGNLFFQVHKSYVVNLSKVQSIEKDDLGSQFILLKGGENKSEDKTASVPLARRRAKEFQEALLG